VYTLQVEDLPSYSYEDYCHWEGDWELIEGVPYSMAPAPIKIHQQLIGYLFKSIASEFDHCPECEILIDEDWKVNSHTVLKPDLSIVCGDSNPMYISKTPEVIFEVQSPSTAKHDEGLKFRLYQEEGVKYYVLVYPKELLAKIYCLEAGKYKKMAECDKDAFSFEGITCPFNLDFAEVFKRFRK